MRLTFVCPRFGDELTVGGAERHALLLAERLPADRYEVELLTTCARDHVSWQNESAPGVLRRGAVTVRLFPADERDGEAYQAMLDRLDGGETLTPDQEKIWLDNSVHSRALYDHLAETAPNRDLLIFIPYLFGLAIRGSQIAPEKSVLIPCLHDECFARLGVVREMFARARGMMFNTPEEIELARSLYDLPEEKVTLVSLGFAPVKASGPRFRRRYLAPEPLILFAGRLEAGKGLALLVEYFRLYIERTHRLCRLLLVGRGRAPVPPGRHGAIHNLGYLPEADKRDAFAAADVLVQPSVRESLSIVLLEGWLAETAALVNAGCAVTRAHCERSGGGLWFADYAGFEEALDWLLDHPAERAALGRGGRRYVADNFNWELVRRRFDEAAARFAGRAAGEGRT